MSAPSRLDNYQTLVYNVKYKRTYAFRRGDLSMKIKKLAKLVVVSLLTIATVLSLSACMKEENYW